MSKPILRSEIISKSKTDADTAKYMVKLVYEYYLLTGDLGLFSATLEKLINGMDFMPRSSSGLIWIDPDHPHTCFGY